MSHLRPLVERAGRYAGHGIDHQHQPFHGELAVQPLSPFAVKLWFRAVGIDGTVYREEHSWIARDEDGRLSLWLIDLSEPGDDEPSADEPSAGRCLQHTLRFGAPPEGTLASLVFGRGSWAEEDQYRAEIALDLWPDGAVSYRRAWGLPQQAYAPRLAVRMSPSEESTWPPST